MDNLLCIQNASELPVYSPLIGLNKTEIMDIAKKIKTYETSILPYNDCCSFMIAQHPETRGKLKEIEEFEKNIENLEKLTNSKTCFEVKSFFICFTLSAFDLIICGETITKENQI